MSTPDIESRETLEYTLDSRQCIEVAQYMYERWQEAMKPPIIAYYDFSTWLAKEKERYTKESA